MFQKAFTTLIAAAVLAVGGSSQAFAKVKTQHGGGGSSVSHAAHASYSLVPTYCEDGLSTDSSYASIQNVNHKAQVYLQVFDDEPNDPCLAHANAAALIKGFTGDLRQISFDTSFNFNANNFVQEPFLGISLPVPANSNLFLIGEYNGGGFAIYDVQFGAVKKVLKNNYTNVLMGDTFLQEEFTDLASLFIVNDGPNEYTFSSIFFGDFTEVIGANSYYITNVVVNGKPVTRTQTTADTSACDILYARVCDGP